MDIQTLFSLSLALQHIDRPSVNSSSPLCALNQNTAVQEEALFPSQRTAAVAAAQYPMTKTKKTQKAHDARNKDSVEENKTKQSTWKDAEKLNSHANAISYPINSF